MKLLGILDVFLGINALLLLVSAYTWGLKWAALVESDKLPDILRKRHNDWVVAKWVPRWMTAFLSNAPPVKLLGTAHKYGHLDILAWHTWVLAWPWYFTKRWDKRQFRIGLRYDYYDGYYTLVFSPYDKVD